ncbi:MAG: twin-arginine translocase subunit TatC [Candidatus Saccharibacteria bacterium]
MKKAKSTKKRSTRTQLPKPAEKQPFLEHVYELRKRLFYVVVSVALFSCAAYSVEHHIVNALLRPSHGQKFIYTSPGGGIDFLFRVCLYIGIACSIPVIVYQLLRYLEPLLKLNTRQAVAWGSIASGILAAIGMTFGYFVGLPSALHFLLNQFVTAQIQPLITIQSYMSFVSVYMLGSALLLQIPLILIIINRIKPLTPKKLLSFTAERWVIVGSLVGGALMNPNPNPIALLMVSGPLIGAYQIGVVIVWMINRRHKTPARIQRLLDQDAQAQAERQAAARAQRPLQLQPAHQNFSRGTVSGQKHAPVLDLRRRQPSPALAATQKVASTSVAPVRPARSQATGTAAQNRPRPGRYINDFAPRPSSYRPIRPLTDAS